MSSVDLYAVGGAAIGTALFHTLIPDHWLPFVLIGRARSWSAGKAAIVAAVSGGIHVLTSTAIALAVLGLGTLGATAIGEGLERGSQWLLVIFGLVYAVWAVRKGGHFHPGGLHVHEPAEPVCEGNEGDTHPEHLHYHADMEWIEGRSRPGVAWLAVIIGINPCLLLLPLMVEGSDGGWPAMVMLVAAYGIPAILLMAGLSALGVATTRRIRLPLAARWMEALSGVLIAALGVGLLLFHH